MILVHARLLSDDFSVDDLTTWYETKHIPEMLATGGVQSAARYELVSGIAHTDGWHLPARWFLAAYRLNDMDWLQTEECGFWKLPMTVEDRHGAKRSIHELVSFQTQFWDIAGERASGEVAGGRCSWRRVRRRGLTCD